MIAGELSLGIAEVLQVERLVPEARSAEEPNGRPGTGTRHSRGAKRRGNACFTGRKRKSDCGRSTVIDEDAVAKVVRLLRSLCKLRLAAFIQ
jgi:hypothetical protein